MNKPGGVPATTLKLVASGDAGSTAQLIVSSESDTEKVNKASEAGWESGNDEYGAAAGSPVHSGSLTRNVDRKYDI